MFKRKNADAYFHYSSRFAYNWIKQSLFNLAVVFLLPFGKPVIYALQEFLAVLFEEFAKFPECLFIHTVWRIDLPLKFCWPYSYRIYVMDKRLCQVS